MSILARDKGGGDFTLVPADLHSAVCDMVVDLGIQPSGSDLYPDRHQVYIRWQIPDERIEYTKDGEKHEGPMVIGKFYTVSLHEKSNLRPDLENWRGKPFTEKELEGFDICRILGVPCMIQVQHKKKNNGDVRAVVSGITKVPKNATPAALEGEGLLYDSNGNQDTFDKLPEWLQKKVQQAIQPEEEDDRPFAPEDHEDEDGVPTGF